MNEFKKEKEGGGGQKRKRDTDESSLGFIRGVVKEKATPTNEIALYIRVRIKDAVPNERS